VLAENVLVQRGHLAVWSAVNEKLKIRVLLVEDNATDALLLREALTEVAGVEFALTHVERLADGLAQLRNEKIDVVLLDLGLPDTRGVDTFIRLHQHEPEVPVLVLTGLDDETTGMKTLQEGAQDYLIKHQLQASLLGRSIRYAIERHRLAAELRDSERRLRTIVQNMPVMMDAFDENGNIIVWNRECEIVSGYSEAEILGNAKAMELLYPDADYRNQMKEEWRRRGNSYRDWAWEMTCKNGAVKTVLWSNSSSIVPIPGWATWGIGVDISARRRAEDLIKASLREKEVLLKEIHHRVKNNLQVINSLLNLQSRQIKDKRTQEIFQESRQRVRAMALIHEELYKSTDLAKIEMASYLRTLTTHLSQSYQGSRQGIMMDVRVENVVLEVGQAIPCGLIINELVTNSLKYAFPDSAKKIKDKKNEVIVEMRPIADNRLLLRVSDNGVGLPKDFNARNCESLGLQLVHTLADQLRAVIAFQNNNGAGFEIVFSSSKPDKKTTPQES
jgi:PAS domain S-box-containing protein